ncbi:dioxygenase family protein [Anthocerotibacter panamensis]|uniref:dioxygenase family protein n=1 Tax=Anthocerotibacter panamensis TaxID=2857077 RepID=UPI001C4018F9|nr:class III extradiol ring-cleavage dioxygenase [Anthocerotibacter panamensis]
MNRFPSVFLSHGSPMLAVTPGPAHTFLRQWSATWSQPRAILCISAHWETLHPTVTTSPQPATIHDFGGFARLLYEIQYLAPGDPGLAQEVVALLQMSGFAGFTHSQRGLDHGAWVPLRLMYPEAQVPVVQLSIQTALGPQHHLALGQALAPLRETGVLLLASGSLTHNLAHIHPDPLAVPQDWVLEFDHWLAKALVEGRTEDLLDYRRRAPFAAVNHPTEEHLLPLFVALGAGGSPVLLHSSYSHSSLSMGAWAFS